MENKNFQITVVILIGFCLVFSSLFILQSIIIVPNLESSQKEFFNKKFDEKIQKVIILGSSQTAPLNTKYIIQKISENHDDYTVYNLSIDADNPKKRLQSLSNIISNKPDIVIYGLDIYNFNVNVEKKSSYDQLLNPKNFFTYQFDDFMKSIQDKIPGSPNDRTISTLKYILFGPDPHHHPFINFD